MDAFASQAAAYHCWESSKSRIGPFIASKSHWLQTVPFIDWIFGNSARWCKFSDDAQLFRQDIGRDMAFIHLYAVAWSHRIEISE